MMNSIRSYVYMLLATACFAVWSCSGEEGVLMPQVPANPDSLCTITPHAIEISQVDASAAPITRSDTGEPESKAMYAENLGVNYSAEATLEAVPEKAQTRAVTNLVTDAQYRIVMFNSSGTIVGNVVYKQGSSAVVSGKAIKLKAGTYRLFAYTFNSTSPICELDADNKNVTVNSGEDFMTYTNDNYTVSSTDYSSGKQLDISFVRQCVRLMVTVKADEYTENTISEASLTVGNIFGSGKSKWNGRTNTDASTLTSVAGTASFTKVSGDARAVDCGPAADNPYLITSPCNNQTITISGLKVTIGGALKEPADFSFPYSVTLTKGGSYRLTISANNYYVLTRTNPVMIGGIKWARTNLQQTESGNNAQVSFVEHPWEIGSYWNWGMRDAFVRGDNFLLGDYVQWNVTIPDHANQDPCRSLGSNWRLPTRDELIVLSKIEAPDEAKVKIDGTIHSFPPKNRYIFRIGVVIISANQVVHLPIAGYIRYNAINETAGSAWYWSSTPSDPRFSPRSSIALCSSSYSNSGQLSEYAILRNYALPLRCVQD